MVRVAEEVAEHVNEALLLDKLGVHVVELGDAEGSGLGDVGVRVLEASAEGLGEVLHDLINTNHSHGADRQRTDERVRVRRILKGINKTKHR